MHEDIFIGHCIDGYKITEFIGSGCNAAVYKAINDKLKDERAVKVIPVEFIQKKESWDQEIIKVNQLRHTEGVVQYHHHEEKTFGEKPFLCVMWDYIPGNSLRQLISNRQVTVQMAFDVVVRALNVFHACKHLGIHHADFHSGNILIENPNPLSIESNRRKVWITDFGYGTFSQTNATPPMADFDGLGRIIQECIDAIDFHELGADDRHLYNILKNQFPKYLHETNPTEGSYVDNPSELLKFLYRMVQTPEILPDSPKDVGDFLAAELIGNRYDEWRSLFVPKFLATDDLLDKNICVLTGLRGCGKTMMFRRLSFELQQELGPAGIPGESSFIGFYLNARVLAEAFPWLPENKYYDAAQQILDYFNVKWSIVVLDWLKSCYATEKHCSAAWLYDFFAPYFPDMVFTSADPVGTVNSIISACQKELLRAKLDSGYSSEKSWPFADYEFLSVFLARISMHHGYTTGKSVYFFLDDYSTPMINETMQKILNPAVFRRTPNLFFKVSTESSESFVKSALNGKVLENGADYKLIDLGSELFKRTGEKNREQIRDIITSIFERRLSRSTLFSGDISLEKLLGKPTFSNNSLAVKIRNNESTALYYGLDVFCELWSSDIRELIKLLAEMISMQSDIRTRIELYASTSTPIIAEDTQNLVMKDAGGRFLHLLETTTNPNRSVPSGQSSETYGTHLKEIVEAFQKIAYHDLKTKDSKNQDSTPPKQARKIELTTAAGAFWDGAEDYYKGLIRYGVFIQDFRGKSVRGTAAQRLYLRGLLIPYSRLTFSRRDSITLDWETFNQLLTTPKTFAQEYVKNLPTVENSPGQLSIELPGEGGK